MESKSGFECKFKKEYKEFLEKNGVIIDKRFQECIIVGKIIYLEEDSSNPIHELLEYMGKDENGKEQYKIIDDVLVKLIINQKEEMEKYVDTEIRMQVLAAKYGISPEIYAVYRCLLDGEYYVAIIMEKIQNAHNINYMLENGGLKGESLDQIYEMLDLLCKENKMIHDDLHGGNIIFDESGRPYIIDFGIISKKENVEDCPKEYDINISIKGKTYVIHLPDKTIQKVTFDWSKFKNVYEDAKFEEKDGFLKLEEKENEKKKV
jgi:tRNA A-37 threonylcarbamoyl transferase component Bud32